MTIYVQYTKQIILHIKHLKKVIPDLASWISHQPCILHNQLADICFAMLHVFLLITITYYIRHGLAHYRVWSINYENNSIPTLSENKLNDSNKIVMEKDKIIDELKAKLERVEGEKKTSKENFNI